MRNWAPRGIRKERSTAGLGGLLVWVDEMGVSGGLLLLCDSEHQSVKDKNQVNEDMDVI